MGENSFDTYAFCTKMDNSVLFIAAVDLGGAFLSSSRHKEQAIFLEELLSLLKKYLKTV